MNDVRPLTTLVAQGWEIVGYSAGTDAKSGIHGHSVLLRRQKQHKVLNIRKKMLSKGLVVSEIDL